MKKSLLMKTISIALMFILLSSIFISFETFGTDNRFDQSAFGNVQGSNELENTTRNAAQIVVVTLRVITTSIAVVILLIIAMRYMISAPGDRADIKKHAVPYVIGVIILFGASGILAIIGKLSSVLTETEAEE